MTMEEPLKYSQEEWTQVINRAFGSLPSTYQSHVTPETGSAEVANLIDHTLLKTDATPQQIDKLCEEARRFQFKTVCVRVEFVARAVAALHGSGVDVACVIDFHEGTSSTAAKVRETIEAVSAGAKELDIVINHPLLHPSHPEFATSYPSIYSSLSSVRNACSSPDVKLKVILETSKLDPKEIVAGSVLSIAAGADFIKTSTGFLGRGAMIDDVHIMASIASDPSILDLRAGEWRSRQVKVKASGGIRSSADLMKMVEAGASRIGTSAGVLIMTETHDADSIKKSADTY